MRLEWRVRQRSRAPSAPGVFVTPSAGDADRVVALAELADRSGLDLVTFQDHPYQSRFLDTWTLLSFVAARTERVALAPNVAEPAAPAARRAGARRREPRHPLRRPGELGLGAGAFWDPIAAMGGPRRTPGRDRSTRWRRRSTSSAPCGRRRGRRRPLEGRHYRLEGAKPGPAPAHDVGIWVGAYKPRMLDLVGRKGDGWLPSLPYLQPGDLAAGNAAIDRAAARGRPRPRGDPPPAERRSRPHVPRTWRALVTEDRIDTLILTADDAASIERLAAETAPAVRELVAARPASAAAPAAVAAAGTARRRPSRRGATEYERLGVTPTSDDRDDWDASPAGTWPRGRTGALRARGDVHPPRPAVGQHLIDVHDMLRTELEELHGILAQVKEGAMAAGDARAALNEMALRQNDWTLGAFCARYCAVVDGHHTLEDSQIFPHLRRSDAALVPVIDRLEEEHLVIHDAIQGVDARSCTT